MTFKKPFWKDFKFWAIALPVLILLGLIFPDPNKEAKELAKKLEKDSLAIVNGEIRYEIKQVMTNGAHTGYLATVVVQDSITEHQAKIFAKWLSENKMEKTIYSLYHEEKPCHLYMFQIEIGSDMFPDYYSVDVENGVPKCTWSGKSSAEKSNPVKASQNSEPSLAQEFNAKIKGKFDYKIVSESYYEMNDDFYKKGKGITSVVTVSRAISMEEAILLCKWLRNFETNLSPKNSQNKESYGEFCLYKIKPVNSKNKLDYNVEVHYHKVNFMDLDYQPKITKRIKTT